MVVPPSGWQGQETACKRGRYRVGARPAVEAGPEERRRLDRAAQGAARAPAGPLGGVASALVRRACRPPSPTPWTVPGGRAWPHSARASPPPLRCAPRAQRATVPSAALCGGHTPSRLTARSSARRNGRLDRVGLPSALELADRVVLAERMRVRTAGPPRVPGGRSPSAASQPHQRACGQSLSPRRVRLFAPSFPPTRSGV